MITNTLSIRDIGPIRSLSFELAPGINVLRSRNGRGKSTAIEVADALASGRSSGLTVRQGALNGEAEGFGITIKIGRKVSRSGEVQIVSLDGKLSVAELVDPGIKNEEAADTKRIKALISLAKVTPSIDVFRPLLNDRREFDRVIPSTVADSPDLLTMADRFKRACDSAALLAERQAENVKGRCQQAEATAKGVDLTAEHDSHKLQDALSDAVRRESKLIERAAAAADAKARADESFKKIEESEQQYKGLSLVDARQNELKANAAFNLATVALRNAEEALAAAQREHETRRRDVAEAIKRRKESEAHEKMLAECKAELAKSVPDAPSEAEIVSARDAVARAQEAVELGAMVRKAIDQLSLADTYRAEWKGASEWASKLREAAAGVDGVLSEIVGKTTSALRVEAGRLVLDTARGATYFAELSHGERWRIALDIAIDAVGEGGILVIPQEAYESLDPLNRDAIHKQSAERVVSILTGEASADEEIVAEHYEPAAV